MDILTEFKVAMQIELEKQGFSLQDLENALVKNDVEFVAEKVASIGDVFASGGKALVTAAPELAFALSAALGAIGGGGLYSIDNHLHNQDNRLKVKKDEVDRVRQVSDRLKTDYNLNPNE